MAGGAAGKGAVAQFLMFLFWLGEAGDFLDFPSLGAELLQQCPHVHSPSDGDISDKCSIYLAPFSA